mmetsp:Transcript_101759/g.323349  ORF Transcript_101759/g.323349 Transcript_101759/m.323349 type:complete len:371 (-) Transcript_101759:435-1547(-)
MPGRDAVGPPALVHVARAVQNAQVPHATDLQRPPHARGYPAVLAGRGKHLAVVAGVDALGLPLAVELDAQSREDLDGAQESELVVPVPHPAGLLGWHVLQVWTQPVGHEDCVRIHLHRPAVVPVLPHVQDPVPGAHEGHAVHEGAPVPVGGGHVAHFHDVQVFAGIVNVEPVVDEEVVGIAPKDALLPAVGMAHELGLVCVCSGEEPTVEGGVAPQVGWRPSGGCGGRDGHGRVGLHRDTRRLLCGQCSGLNRGLRGSLRGGLQQRGRGLRSGLSHGLRGGLRGGLQRCGCGLRSGLHGGLQRHGRCLQGGRGLRGSFRGGLQRRGRGARGGLHSGLQRRGLCLRDGLHGGLRRRGRCLRGGLLSLPQTL